MTTFKELERMLRALRREVESAGGDFDNSIVVLNEGDSSGDISMETILDVLEGK